MAQTVGYYDNDITYTEGPFVYCTVGRIEVEKKGHRCPVVIDQTIYGLLKNERPDWRKDYLAAVDWLNSLVGDKIKLVDGVYICEYFSY